MIISFGYKHGTPTAHKVVDVRELTHNMSDQSVIDKIAEIRSYASLHPGENIAIGCDKGQHRSRVIANAVATFLRTSVYHRDHA